MINIELNINNLIKKYCMENEKCCAASVIKFDTQLIYTIHLSAVNDNHQRIITENNNEINVYDFDYILAPAVACVLPVLADICCDVQLTNVNANDIILSGDNIICSYLNYSMKFNGVSSILCAGRNKAKLLYLVSHTDINLFYNADTQNEDEIVIDDYKVNIVVDGDYDNLIKKSIPKIRYKYNSNNKNQDIVYRFAKWLSDRKVNEDTFFTQISDLSSLSAINENELLTAIFINKD